MLPFERLSINGPPAWYFCEIGWQWAPPPLPDFDLWFVQSGRGELRFNNSQFELSGGACFVLQPDCRPVAWHDPLHPLRVFYCHFTLEKWDGTPLWPDGALVRDASFFVLSAHRTQTFWRRGDDIGREMARRGVEQMVLSLWDEAHQPLLSDQEGELDELLDAIRREPARAWNLDDMAFAVNLSRAQFVRRFRVRFGSSPMALVSQIRLERAQQLLRESHLSLDSIARAVGYGDAPFLSKNFKTAFGVAPGVWRKRAKNSQKIFESVIDKANESL
ncbi:RCS-specific HTH-type transcriptional activator RclR [Abditibacteriota bacterium]|nr:RCS-specific HTH-type transcriptional activator RclR [Abditibacteriota bacterium]